MRRDFKARSFSIELYILNDSKLYCGLAHSCQNPYYNENDRSGLAFPNSLVISLNLPDLTRADSLLIFYF